ncbi:MAG: hypothetical protein KDA21_12370, partial [Phycisphaerales bacterium]|nr:hypothetical protein [Phycisphaerales bacterium]
MLRDLGGVGRAAVVLVCLLVAGRLQGHQVRVELDEMARVADMVVVGTVVSSRCRVADQGMIVTDVELGDTDVVRASGSAPTIEDGRLVLTFPGGTVEGRTLRVCCGVTLETGSRYLLFAFDPDRRALHPTVGAGQGVYRVIGDARSHALYPVTLEGAGVAAVEAGCVVLTGQRVSSITDGTARLVPPPGRMAATPDVSDARRAGAWVPESDETAMVMTLETFCDEVRRLAAQPPRRPGVLRLGGGAPTGQVDAVEVPLVRGEDRRSPADRRERDAALKSLTHPTPADEHGSTASTDGDRALLCYCGWLDAPKTFEQVPANWWSYPLIADGMWQYNLVMDIYRAAAHQQSIGDNGISEFVGWLNNEGLQFVYGVDWLGTIAVAYMWSYDNCGEMTQVDIIFNAEYTWTDDFDFALGNADVINYLPVLMHEMGHSWGAQRGSVCTEDYSYDRPGVMHAYYTTIIEDGHGIHSWDAQALRDNYDDQLSIPARVDVGVESYYSSAGALTNSKMDSVHYYPGSAFTLKNLTIENMSSAETDGVRVR